MISTDAFAGAFGGGHTDDMARVAKNAARLGFAVVPVEPMGKAPICPLPARAARMADLEANKLGLRKHPCGVHHATTDPLEADRWFKRLAKERPGLNIGIEAGKSRLILVDCDDVQAVEAWTVAWAEQYHGFHGDTVPTPTVLTPGRQLADGTWAHKDGAHFWYSLPEGEDLPTDGPGSMQLAGGVSVSWRDRQALVPPSVREEGPYRLVGKVEPAPEWLLDMITYYALTQAEKRTTVKAKIDGTDDIDAWSAGPNASWPELLEPAGWVNTRAIDSCGPFCDIWTRPGEAGSAKSATAHEPGCTVTDTSTGWGPLHVWSDIAAEELGSRHLSKLQFYALTQHGGDIGSAMAALALTPSASQEAGGDLERVLDAAWAGLQAQRDREPDAEGSPGGSGSSHLFADLGAILNGTAEPGPTPAVLARTDGEALFYPGTLNGLFGEPESGKSWVALAAVAEVLNRGGSAAYLDVDGNGAPSLIARLQLLGADVAAAVAGSRLAIADRVEDKPGLLLFIKAMVELAPDLVIIDALGDALPMYGAKTESNDEVIIFLNLLATIAKRGSAVVTVDHVTKNADTRGGYAIGAQSKKARMDGAYMIVSPKDGFARGRGGSAYLNKSKDRHGYVAAMSTPRPAELWGTFVLEQDGGWAVVPPGPGQQEVAAGESEGEAMERAMVLVSAYLERLAADAAELGSPDLGIVSAEGIRTAQIGVRRANVQPALNRLQDGGFVAKVARGRHAAWSTVKPYVELQP